MLKVLNSIEYYYIKLKYNHIVDSLVKYTCVSVSLLSCCGMWMKRAK